MVDALRAGANGYVLKSSEYDELMTAIHWVDRHGSISTRAWPGPFEELKAGRPREPEIPFQATPRELTVLQLCADG